MHTSHRSLSLREKVDIISRIQAGKRQAEICRTDGLSKSTVSGVWRARESIIHHFENDQPNRKRIKKLDFEEMDSALLDWFSIQRSLNIPVNSSLLRAKSIELAQNFNYPNFKCSDGWLDKWKKRHDISFRGNSGDGGKVDLHVVNNWIKNTWEGERKDYLPRDIYNADETGCFWSILPDQSFHFENETCSGGSKSKERITILFCTNSDGSDKRKPLVIGKFPNPRAFRLIKNRSSLPVEYFFDSKSWMTAKIFEGWLKRLDNEMGIKKRNIILTLDNVSTHPQEIHLKNIKLVYFPPNCKSNLQPLEQGIIQNFKAKYRHLIVQKVIHKIETQMEPKVNLLEAIFAIHSAWLQVTSLTIQNCFKHCKITTEFPVSTYGLNEKNDIADDTTAGFNIICYYMGVPEGLGFQEYANIDSQVVTSANSNDYGVKAIAMKHKIEAGEEDTDESDSPEEQDVAAVTTDQALGAVDLIRTWLLSQDKHGDGNIDIICQLEDVMFRSRMAVLKHTPIVHHFN